MPDLDEGEVAECPRCQASLVRRCHADWQRVAALSLSACVALGMALSGPFLSLRSAGGDPSSTLAQTPWRLALERPLLGVIVAALFVAIPAVQAIGLFCISVAFLGTRPGRVWGRVARFLDALQPWSMADVFIVGVLVSLTKIASLARVEYGAAFWSFIAFALLLAGASASFDARRAFFIVSERYHVR